MTIEDMIRKVVGAGKQIVIREHKNRSVATGDLAVLPVQGGGIGIIFPSGDTDGTFNMATAAKLFEEQVEGLTP